MLIRVRGGSSGVFRYLRDGKKSGRRYSRDELDERVVLSGNMGLAESVVNAMRTQGQKYLHITLAFKEDELPQHSLRAITEEFQQFCMTAFRLDEYAFYAEAHLPKIKTYTNLKTGLKVIRKPHIHIVIPELNLLSHRRMNPFGKVDYQTRYLEAFQEHINSKYGLASPKDNRRIAFTDESTLISRNKGDHFQGIGSELKQRLLNAIIERNVLVFAEFQQLASEFGAVRVRNEGKSNAYLNIRPGGTKGINLKEHVFSQEFITLPTAEKIRRLAAEVKRMEAESAEYVEAKSPRPSPDEITDRLTEWHAFRARELKYINSGNRALYAAYKASDSAGKLTLLSEREAAFYQKYDTDQHADAGLGDMQLDEIELGSAGDPSADAEAGDLKTREPESVIEQLLVEHKKEVAEEQLAASKEHKTIKLSLDANLLIARLSHTHGVVPEKYPVTKGADGGDRIQCGSRKLNVSDFLTKELHLPWPEAEAMLREAYAVQQASVAAQSREEIRSHFWQAYRQTWPARRADKEKDWAAQKASESGRRAQIKAEYLRDRAGIKADLDKSPAERKAAYSLASMRKTLESAKLYQQIALERQALREKHQQPGREGYQLFLVVLAEDCNAGALAELRQQAQRAKPTASGNRLGAERERDPSMPVVLPSVSYRVDQRGNVTYYADSERTKPILVDTGREVEVVDLALEAVETGLRLALQKFGPALDVNGSPEFKAAVLGVVLRTGLRVELKDSALADELERLRSVSSQQSRLPRSMPMTQKTDEEVEAEWAAEGYGIDDSEQVVHEPQEEQQDDASYRIALDGSTDKTPKRGNDGLKMPY